MNHAYMQCDSALMPPWSHPFAGTILWNPCRLEREVRRRGGTARKLVCALQLLSCEWLCHRAQHPHWGGSHPDFSHCWGDLTGQSVAEMKRENKLSNAEKRLFYLPVSQTRNTLKDTISRVLRSIFGTILLSWRTSTLSWDVEFNYSSFTGDVTVLWEKCFMYMNEFATYWFFSYLLLYISTSQLFFFFFN